jgi:hypothetical protein
MTDPVTRMTRCRAFNRPRVAIVDQYQAGSFGEDQVGGLDVAVDDLPVAMEMAQGVCHTLHQSDGFGRGNAWPSLIAYSAQHRTQIESVNPRHDDPDAALLASIVKDLQNFVIAAGESLERLHSPQCAVRFRQHVQGSHLFYGRVIDLVSPTPDRANFCDGKIVTSTNPKSFDDWIFSPPKSDRPVAHG